MQHIHQVITNPFALSQFAWFQFYFSFRFVFRLIEPLCLGGFVGYFSPADGFRTTPSDAYWYATGIVFCTAFTVIMIHPFNFYMTKVSTKIRLACSGLIYQKVLRLTKSSMDENQTGTVINLISNDLDKFGAGIEALHNIWRGPLESAAFFTIIYLEIGVASVIGMVFLLSFMPLQRKKWFFFIFTAKCFIRFDFFSLLK